MENVNLSQKICGPLGANLVTKSEKHLGEGLRRVFTPQCGAAAPVSLSSIPFHRWQ